MSSLGLTTRTTRESQSGVMKEADVQNNIFEGGQSHV